MNQKVSESSSFLTQNAGKMKNTLEMHKNGTGTGPMVQYSLGVKFLLLFCFHVVKSLMPIMALLPTFFNYEKLY